MAKTQVAPKRGWEEVGGEKTPLTARLTLLLDEAVSFACSFPVQGANPVQRERFRARQQDLRRRRDELVGFVEAGSGQGK